MQCSLDRFLYRKDRLLNLMERNQKSRKRNKDKKRFKRYGLTPGNIMKKNRRKKMQTKGGNIFAKNGKRNLSFA